MNDRYVNKSLQRALRILDVFTPENRLLTATDIANQLNALPGTIYPSLATLERAGYLMRDEHKRYCLGLKVLERANLVLARLDLRSVAQPHLRQIAREHRVNAHLAVLYESSVMYLHREEGYPSVIIREVVGQRVPAYCTALGKVLLASLPEEARDAYLQTSQLTALTPFTIVDPMRLRGELQAVADQGYAVDNEEFHEGSLCVAAPVRDYRGSVIAAASLSVTKSLAAGGQLQRLVSVISDCAASISHEFGHYAR
jgi:IclR family transcriptional regulator, KDG regulon repressor